MARDISKMGRLVEGRNPTLHNGSQPNLRLWRHPALVPLVGWVERGQKCWVSFLYPDPEALSSTMICSQKRNPTMRWRVLTQPKLPKKTFLFYLGYGYQGDVGFRSSTQPTIIPVSAEIFANTLVLCCSIRQGV